MLPKSARVLMGLAALMLVGLYFVPLWNISLSAPQYPEGLGMRIWLDAITGFKPNDLDNINNLNHYIGMKRIVPDSIPELRYMPVIVGCLIAFALATAAIGWRRLAQAWVGAFAVLALVGLLDFYRWERDYGTNLDMENAIIKIPGMTYQPPLIGSKQLLNFRATSLPATGAILAFIAMGFGVAAIVIGSRDRRAQASRAAGKMPAMAGLRAEGRG